MIEVLVQKNGCKRVLGSWEWVQLTHCSLRVSPVGDEVAVYKYADWVLNDGSEWSDIILYDSITTMFNDLKNI